MHVDGGCHCGFLTYEAEIDPDRVTICHCQDCQVLTGTAFRTTVGVAEDKFRMTGGVPQIYVKTAESGNPRAQAFCPNCGTPIYATSVGEGPKTYGLRIGTIRQRAGLKPSLAIWCRSALPWVDEIGGIAQRRTEA